MAAIDRIFEILDETDEIPDLPDARLLEQPKGKIAFKMYSLVTHQIKY